MEPPAPVLPPRADVVTTWILASLLFQGCTLVGGPSPSPTSPAERPAAWTETGMASWYGDPFHGRPTASGETYDMNELTGAHRTLPFGTRLRVQNLDNGHSVTIRINDRGPFAKERILDVSRKAAQELGMIGPGTARVRITVLGAPPSPPPPWPAPDPARPPAIPE